ncbi:hypothetical protein LCGC14_0561800 [marine sediment metagenome]|uniref:Uncharacterized protein n=1 Tax=marine sediment metagenome TaxID=412755 RepID=A0A0F9UUZ6_9ZZZZ
MTAVSRRGVYYGKQGAVGSSVVVDTNIRANCSLKPTATKVQPEENIGQHGPNRHYISNIMAEGSLTMDSAVYEQILIPLWLAMGSVSPTGGPDYIWAFTLPFRTDAISLISPLTMEYIDSGPSNGGGDGGGTYVVRLVDAFATGLTISGNAPEGWKVEAELSGRVIDLPDSLSGNPEPDQTVTPIKMGETTLAVDALYANIGDTAVTEFISFTWKLEDNYHSKQFAGSMYPNGWGTGRWKTSLELVLEVSAAAAQAFADAVLTTSLYAVRVKGYASASDNCNIDGMYYVDGVDTLDDRDGNNIIKVSLLGVIDTLGNAGVVTVITDVADL